MAICLIITSCEKNHTPTISEIIQDPATASAGTIYIFSAESSDEDGDNLEYTWTSDGGEFLSPINSKEVKWRSPVNGEGESFSIIVSVNDGEFEVSKELIIVLTKPVLGGILGTVCYSNTKIPIAGVRISIANYETFTAINGDFSISDLVSRNDTLVASKKDFGPIETVVTIPPNAILHYDFEMLSVANSSKLSGKITDQENLPVKNTEIVVSNPNGTESRLRAFTDDNGQYKILYVPFGKREVIVRKAISEEYKYIDLMDEIVFSEVEQRIDFVIEKISLIGSFIDIRDGQDYPYKTIGDQTWMVTNLAYLPEVNPPSELSDNKPYYYVYNYHGTDTTKAKRLEIYINYGVLYNWQSARRSCPIGWHLPSKDDWNKLLNELWPNTSEKMRTTSGWDNANRSTNVSGFSALPAGQLNNQGEFAGMGNASYFQSSTESSSERSWFSSIHSASINVLPDIGYKKAGYSIRCIRNK